MIRNTVFEVALCFVCQESTFLLIHQPLWALVKPNNCFCLPQEFFRFLNNLVSCMFKQKEKLKSNVFNTNLTNVFMIMKNVQSCVCIYVYLKKPSTISFCKF